MTLCCFLPGCTSVPKMQPAAAQRTFPYHPFPNVPSGYENRFGQVAARCMVLPDRHLARCRVLAVEGGPAYSDAVMNWLTDPRRPPLGPHREEADPAYHTWLITFAGVGIVEPQRTPVAGGAPVAPPGYQPRKRHGTTADCAIYADGAPRDCRIVGVEPSDPLAIATLAWLQSGAVRYQVAPFLSSGTRRLVVTPPPG